MKSKKSHILFLLAAASSVASQASAAPDNWLGGTASWNTPGNWSSTATPISTDTVTYTGLTNLTQTLDGSYSIAGIAFGAANGTAQAYVINNGTGTNLLTLATGGIDTTGFDSSDTLTINANIVLNGDQTWKAVNGSSANDITVNGVVSGTGALALGWGASGNGSGGIKLTGLNTYTGVTTIRGSGVSTVSNTSFVEVTTIGNGGVAGNLGQASNAATNLIFGQSGQSTGQLNYVGSGESTDRLFTINGNAVIVNNGSGALNFTNAGTINNNGGARTLTLAGTNTATSSIAGAINNNTSIVKTGAGTWALTGASSFSGTTAIQGGVLSINSIKSVNGGASALGAVSTAANGTIAIGATTTGATLKYTGAGDTTDRVINLAGTTGGATLDQSGTGLLKFASAFTAGGAGSKTLTLTGSTTGTGEIAGVIVDNLTGTNTTAVSKTGTGTWRLSGANTYTGGTTVNVGTLNLDFSATGAPANQILASTGALTLAGGKLTLVGHASQANSQTVSGLTLNAGASAVGLTANGNPLSLTLGAINRNNAGATVDFTLPTGTLSLTNGINNSTAGTANTILTAANGAAYATVGGIDWAAKDASNTSIVGLSTLSGYTNFPADTGSLSGNADLTGTAASYTLTADSSTTTIRSLAAGNTVALGAFNLTTGGILSNSNLTITGSTGSLKAASSGGDLVFIQTANTITVGSTIANNNTASSLTKSGAGTLIILSGANTYTGKTYLNQGILQISTDAGLGTAPASAVADQLTLNGGTLQFGAAMTLAANRGVTLGANGGTFDTNGSNSDLSGVVAGTGSLTKSGTGTLSLSGATANTYTGLTTISAGTLSLSKNDGVVAVAGDILVNGTGILSTTASASGRIADSSNVTVDGASAQFQFGTNQNDTINALAVNNGGTFAIGGLGSNLRPNGGITSTGGGFITGSGSQLGLDFNGAIRTVDVAANTLTIGVSITNGGLNKQGAGTLILNGSASTYTGITTITAGTLSVASINDGGVAGNLGKASNAAANLVFDGGMLQYTGATASTDRAFTINTVKAGTIEVTNSATNLTLTGAAAATSGSLVKSGAGALTLSGANNYTGTTTVNGGTLRAGASTSVFGINSAVTLANTAGVVLDLNGNNVAIGSLAGGGATGGKVALGAGIFTTGGNNTNTSFDGLIEGSGGLTKTGTGTLSLSGATANTYSGLTTVSAGTLSLTKNDGVVAVAGNILVNGTGILSTSINTSGRIADSSNVTVDGVSAQFQFGSNQNDTINTLAVNNGGTVAIGGFSSNLRPNGGITSTGGGSITGNAAQLGLNFNGSTRTVDVAANALTIGVSITNGGLTKQGAGTLILNGSASDYTGATTVNGGTLRAGASTTVFGSNSAVTLANTAGVILDLNGNNVAFGSLAGGGPTGGKVSLGSGTLTTGGNNTSTSFAGIIEGTGGLTKSGAGALTLSGVNTYTGATSVSAGTLLVTGQLGNTAVSVTNNASLVNNGTIAGQVTAEPLATVQGTGAFTSTAAATINGTLSPGNSPGFQSFAGDLTLGGTANSIFELAGANRSTISLTGATYYDAVDVIGQLKLAGTVTVSLFGGFVPADGNSFKLFNFGSIDSTAFNVSTDLVLPGLDGGLTWDNSSFTTNGTVTVIPEASTALLGSLGLLALLRRRRK